MHRNDDQGCCPAGASDSCRGETDVTRRRFLSVTAGVAGAAFVAGPFTMRDFRSAPNPDHFVPADKKLAPDWLRALTARGEPRWLAGEELRTVGMPVGGICAGQVYLSGDGRLVNWDVFNAGANSGYGAWNYREGRAPTERVEQPNGLVEAEPVDQGVALHVRRGDEATVRFLDERGFRSIRFCGEYPLARVELADADVPVRATLEAFSPFVPLVPEDSSLPVTILRYTLENTIDEPLEVTVAGFLQNAVCRASAADRFVGRVVRRNRVIEDPELAAVLMGARLAELPEADSVEPPLSFATFEGGDYGGWTAEGEAFGSAPARGTLPNQQEVTGFEGEALVNSYLGGDRPVGRLVSPEFVVERPFVSFLIGGGGHRGETCLNLTVDGEVVRTATGRNVERLEPRSWDVRDLRGRRARLEIVDAASGGWGHVNVDSVTFRDRPLGAEAGDLREAPDHGTMCIAVLGEAGASRVRAVPAAGEGPEGLFDRDGDLAGSAEPPELESVSAEGPRGAVGRRVRIAPRERATITFVVAWHFPELWTQGRRVGHHYASRFGDALEAVRYVARDLERLGTQTRLWHRTWYDSTLPRWLLDRVHSTAANLATTTCQWWRDGRFWAFEGAGCCHGTCGHVWNYAQGLARLFPSLERSVRERQDFAEGVGFDAETGRIAFRGEGWRLWAGDAQAGYVLKAWREHLCSPDDAFLRRIWPMVRKALEFLVERDAEGGESADGVLEGRQHNTYDIDWFGANPMVGSLYLAALRAGEEMARIASDDSFADRCRALFESGSRLVAERLFDGEYFVQEVDLAAHPEWQFGDGCLADQVFGQAWAHQVGLGHVLPREQVRTALRSIWKYCWAPDVGPQNSAHAPERWFARPGEAGLFTCTWPKSPHMGPRSTRYRNEIWTGIEYQVAAHMAFEGMVTEALAICRAVHERYDASKRNPWNEVECGDHYARSLASFGVPIALAGFEYDGPAGRLGLAPRITPEDFRCAFTAAEGWGSLSQRRDATRQTNTVELRFGELRLAELCVEIPEAAEPRGVEVTVRGAAQRHDVTRDGARLRIGLPGDVLLAAGEAAAITVTFR